MFFCLFPLPVSPELMLLSKKASRARYRLKVFSFYSNGAPIIITTSKPTWLPMASNRTISTTQVHTPIYNEHLNTMY